MPGACSRNPSGSWFFSAGAYLSSSIGSWTSSTRFLADEDGRFTAETLYGTGSDEILDKVKRSNGMIVNFPKGEGEVFHAGSCEWVAGLLRKDAMVEKVTANVLDRYLGKT